MKGGAEKESDGIAKIRCEFLTQILPQSALAF